MKLASLCSVAACGAAALLAGCGPSPNPVVGRVTGSSDQLPVRPLSAELAQPIWTPDAGRMAASVRRRHIPPQLAEETLFLDSLASKDGRAPAGWRTFGSVLLRPYHAAGADGLEILSGAAARPEAPAGLERDLDAVRLAGRDARLELSFACPSSSRAKALAGIRLAVIATNTAGTSGFVSLPITADVSPGWEHQCWHVRFDPDLRSARLRVLLTAPETSLLLASLHVASKDPLAGPLTSRATRQASARMVNLIRDGNFETGQPHFFASALDRWPDDEEMTVPLHWQFDEHSAVGATCVLVNADAPSSRIGFGPLSLLSDGGAQAAASPWYLTFYARSAVPRGVAVLLQTRRGVLGRTIFQTGPEWKRFTHVFAVSPRNWEERLEFAAAELVFDLPGTDSGDPRCWLDAVALTDMPLDRAAPASGRANVEIGLLGPRPDVDDIRNLLDVKDSISFGIRLVAQGAAASGAATTTAPAGQLVLDVLDAWDQVVWTRSSSPVLLSSGRYDETIRVQLPRGYYRVLASLWTGHPGESELLCGSHMAMVVISSTDAVPLGNPFGLSANVGAISAHTTHVGAGWVRLDLSAHRLQNPAGGWNLDLWQQVMAACDQVHVQAVVGVAPPSGLEATKAFCAQMLSVKAPPPMAIVVSPPAISAQPGREYLDELSVLRDLAGRQGGEVLVARDLAAGQGTGAPSPASRPDGQSSDVVAFSCTPTVLPETSESLLYSIGRDQRGRRLWDLRVSAPAGGAPDPCRHLRPAELDGAARPVCLLAEKPDPVLSASRMIRALLIRSLAGVEMACCDTVALAPVRSTCDDDRPCFHEHDLSPRVALVAFDLLTSLLNDAALVRWLDLPGGARVLYFEKADGGAVAALWRPFGFSWTRLVFNKLPDSVRLVDCTGFGEPPAREAGAKVIKVNEVVCFLVAQPDQRKALSDSLASIHVLP